MPIDIHFVLAPWMAPFALGFVCGAVVGIVGTVIVIFKDFSIGF